MGIRFPGVGKNERLVMKSHDACNRRPVVTRPPIPPPSGDGYRGVLVISSDMGTTDDH